MANPIRFKRGLKANLPTLALAEPAITTDTKEVFIGNGTNNTQLAPTVSPAFTGVPTAPTASAGSNTTQLATNNFVTTAVANKTSVTGNAGSATVLQTARTINGVSFNGSANIVVADSTKLPSGSNAVSATKLVTPRTINGVSFDGTANITVTDSILQTNLRSVYAGQGASKIGIADAGDKYASTDVESALLEISNRYSNPNLLINGDFKVWTKGTVFSAYDSMTADTWRMISGFGVASVERLSDGLKLHSGSLNDYSSISQSVENINALKGKTLTISTRCKNTSSLESGFVVFTGLTPVETYFVPTGVFNNYSFTFVLPTNATDCRVEFRSKGLNSDTVFEWVKLEIGSIATPFIPRIYAEEIMMCERYERTELVVPYSNPNLLINGDFQIWQRGTSFIGAITGAYTSDRWKLLGGIANVSVVKSGKYMKLTMNNSAFAITQPIETNSALIGKIVTLSFKIKASTNMNILCKVSDYSRTDFTPSKVVGVTTTEQTITLTTTITQILNQLMIIISSNELVVTGDVYITDVKLELGAIATPFFPRPYGEELALCQRYYCRISMGYTPLYKSGTTQIMYSSNSQFPVTMRVPPTVTALNCFIDNIGSRPSTNAINIGASVDGLTGLTINGFIESDIDFMFNVAGKEKYLGGSLFAFDAEM